MQLYYSVVCFNNVKWKRISKASDISITSDISISKDGTCWFLSTKDKALVGFKDNNIIESIPLPTKMGIPRFFINTSDEKCLVLMDTLYYKKSDQWSTVAIPEEYFSSYDISYLKVDDEGYIWFTTGSDLLRYSLARNEWDKISLSSTCDFRFYSISKLVADGDDNLWICIGSFHHFDTKKWTLYDPFKGAPPINFESDNQGRLHLASFQARGDSIVLFTAFKEDRNPDGFWSVAQCTLETGSCNIICYNPAANAWVYNTNYYTKGFGINIVREGKKEFLHYPGNDSTKSLAGLDVTDNGTLWALTYNNLFFRYENGSWEKNQPEQSLISDTITGILGGNGDTLWVGTGKGSLARFDGTQWQKIDTKLDDKSLLLPLFYDVKRGELWCKAYWKYQIFNSLAMKFVQVYNGDGLYRFKNTAGTHYTTLNSGIFDSEINSVAPDGNGIWVASREGLAYWDRRKTAISTQKVLFKGMNQKTHYFRTQITCNNQLKLHFGYPGSFLLSLYHLDGQLIQTVDIGKRDAGFNLINLSDYVNRDYAQNMIIVNIDIKQ
jgi:hypothetical protein